MQKRTKRLLLIGLLLPVSCGINTGIYSCISASHGTCDDYGTTDQLTAATRCGLTSGGSMQHNACPTANRVGRCAESGKTISYYSPTFDAAAAQTACGTDGGTFSAR